MKTRWLALVGIVVLAVWSRLIPHPWNFTALGAAALFAGTYFQSRILSMLIPALALVVSDLILGFYSSMGFVYVAFAFTVIIGWSLKASFATDDQESGTAKLVKKTSHTVLYTLLASCSFFLISNFGVWMLDGMYAHSFAGLKECYVMAIPFFGNQVAGDLFYVAILFGGFEFVQSRIPALVNK